MAYQTGNAANIADLQFKIATFLQSLNSGWVVDAINAEKSELYLHNADGYWSLGLLSSNANILYCYGNTGYMPTLALNAQPGSSAIYQTSESLGYYYGTGTTLPSGPWVSYDFFATAQYMHVVVQVTTGQYRHFGFGTLNKEGSYSGGQYVYGTYAPVPTAFDSHNALPFPDYISGLNSYYSTRRASCVRVDNESGPYWYLVGNPQAGRRGQGLGATGGLRNAGSSRHPDALLVAVSQSNFGQSLTPVPNSILITTPDNLVRRVGVVPDFYVTLMAGVTPRARFDIAGDEWMIIPPLGQQSSTSGVPDGQGNSYQGGYAYRIID